MASYFGVHGLALAAGGVLGGLGGGALYGLAERAGSWWVGHLPELVFGLWGIGVATYLVRLPRRETPAPPAP